MFKVGQRVWDIANKEFVIFKQVSKEHSMDTLAVIQRQDELQHYPVRLLHQTADDMFKELGYNPYTLCLNDDLVGYQWHDKDFNDHTIRNIMFYKDKTWNIFQDNICKAIVFDRPTIKEHLAIHQKMIELGWIE
jgi:hypothetical protein